MEKKGLENICFSFGMGFYASELVIAQCGCFVDMNDERGVMDLVEWNL